MGSDGEKRAGSHQLLSDVHYLDANYDHTGRVYIQGEEGPEHARFTANIRIQIKEGKTEQELPVK